MLYTLSAVQVLALYDELGLLESKVCVGGAQRVAEYVAALQIDEDVAVARRVGLDEASCATLRVCTMLLKRMLRGQAGGKGGSADADNATGVTPKDVSALLMRDRFDEPSTLERLCARALGVPDAENLTDKGLVDFVQSAQRRGQGSRSEVGVFIPSPDFYERFEALLECEICCARTTHTADD